MNANEITLNDLRLLKGSEISLPEDSALLEINGVSIDSRTAAPGNVFFAIKGERFDGHVFIRDVIAAGIRVIIVSANWRTPEGVMPKEEVLKRTAIVRVPDTTHALGELAVIFRKKFNIPVVGITGTNGKTTTKEMTASVLGQKYTTLKSEGNYNNHIGVPLTLFKLTGKTQAAVIEMGASFTGEILNLCAIALPTHGIITNIGKGHLEFFKTQDEIFRTKIALLKAVEENGGGFVNGDDPRLSGCKNEFKNVKTFGLSSNADIRGEFLSMLADGTYSFLLNGGKKISLRVPGIKNVYNALAAAGAGLSLGLSDSEIRTGLELYTGYKQRMKIFEWKGITIIDDSYNANPDSMRAVLEFLTEYPVRGRRYAVLGDMLEIGETSAAEHESLGIEAARLGIHRIIAVGKDVRYLVQGARRAGIEAANLVPDHKTAADVLFSELQPGDTVLFKGSRGSTMEKVIEFLIGIPV